MISSPVNTAIAVRMVFLRGIRWVFLRRRVSRYPRSHVAVKERAGSVVSQFETVATQSPPIHRGGGAGGALGNPIGLSGPPPAGRLPVRLSRRTTTGFPKAPPTPPALSAVLKVGSTTRVARLS